MDIGQILSWVVGAVGLTGFYFAGKRVWWSWYINLFCQALWISYALVTGQPAFLATAAVYSVIFGINAYKWTKDHRVAKKIWASEPGTITKFGNTTITRLPDSSEDESNLIKHARHELKLIGEEQAVIDWYVRVIREYASFGHSGGSHMAVMPSLTRLLNFQPLTPPTNNPDEWIRHEEDVWGEAGGIWQNKRDSRCFSNDGGLSYTMVEDSKDEKGNRPVYYSQLDYAHVP